MNESKPSTTRRSIDAARVVWFCIKLIASLLNSSGSAKFSSSSEALTYSLELVFRAISSLG